MAFCLTSFSTQPPPERADLAAVGVDDHHRPGLLRRRAAGLDHLAEDQRRSCSRAWIICLTSSRMPLPPSRPSAEYLLRWRPPLGTLPAECVVWCDEMSLSHRITRVEVMGLSAPRSCGGRILVG